MPQEQHPNETVEITPLATARTTTTVTSHGLWSQRAQTERQRQQLPTPLEALRSIAVTPNSARSIRAALEVYSDSPKSLMSKAALGKPEARTSRHTRSTLPVLQSIFGTFGRWW